MPRFSVVYTIEGSIDFEAATPEEAMAKFEKMDQRELGELGELIVLSDPLVEEVGEGASHDERVGAVEAR